MSTPIIDFQVRNSSDPRVILIDDSSRWAFIENKVSIIEIIIPGRTQPVVTYFYKGETNIFNSLTLGVNCISGCEDFEFQDLPDGIYYITVKGSPSKFKKERKYFRDVNLRLRKDLIYLSSNILENNNIIKTLQNVEMLLDSANANTKYDNIENAQALYNKALEIIEELENCQDCKEDVYSEYTSQNCC